ncbi:hypothetical protein [Rhodopirellula sp. SWK7]|uniref:hypothetical protein n=1 Tax=Rhodopirellula sp. SWK7 TaxID=595460 RepID=UPI0002BFAAC2|nr:hypothetical protein [Rhodopirellula sp. SWK7]EMI42111.1 hypothetical protein RRSWK_05403 [Rhodopirellula sp. SWK7]
MSESLPNRFLQKTQLAIGSGLSRRVFANNVDVGTRTGMEADDCSSNAAQNLLRDCLQQEFE